MPMHKVGYRGWQGTRVPVSQRWWIISSSGIRLALKSKWVQRMMFVCWLPVFYWGLGVFFLEQYMARPEFQQGFSNVVETQEMLDELPDNITINPNGDLPPGFEFTDGRLILPNGLEIVDGELRLPGGEKFPEGVDLPDEIPLPDGFQISHGEDDKIEITIGEPNDFVSELEDDFEMLPKLDMLIDALQQPDNNTRHVVWSWLMMTLFRYPQATMILFLLGFIAPKLISRDVRSRAYLLYFSRPIGRFEYIIGKLVIPTAFIVFITLLPAMALYVFGIMLSPDFSVISATWDIPFRLLLASVLLILPMASIALMLSSLTQESRFATFAWFAVWSLGHGAWFAIVLTQAVTSDSAPIESQIYDAPMVKNWSLISLYNNLGQVQSWAFGFEPFANVWPSLLVLTGVTIGSLLILLRRVSAPLRI